ncbi:hypothetical protein BDR07DRAFT_1613161 [Suillus spraguei]|nr:hypothetical protein BDR07DRAFT_1613161 [Suillus spraguei]
MMSETGLETNDQLKHYAKAIQSSEVGHTLTSVHGIKTSKILDAMMDGAVEAGLSSGLRYAAAAIIVAYQKGIASNTSASDLTRLVEDWLLFFIWPFKKVAHSPQSESSTPLSASEVVADTVPVMSQGPAFRNLSANEKVISVWSPNIYKGPHPRNPPIREGYLEAAHILRGSIIHEHCGSNGTINIINHYTNLPASIMNDAAGIIDRPENGMLLDLVMHRQFDSFAWCLHSDIMHKYTVHWFDHKAGWDHFTQVRFQDHSQNAIALPDPSLIALHSAVAHVLHLSGAAKVIDNVL